MAVMIADSGSNNDDLSYTEAVEYGGGLAEIEPSGSQRDEDECLGDDAYSMDNGQISDSGGDLTSLYGHSSTEITGSGAEDYGVESDVDQSEIVGQMPTEQFAVNNITNAKEVIHREKGRLTTEVHAFTDITVRSASSQKRPKKMKPKKKVKQLSAAAIKKASFEKYNLDAGDDDDDNEI
jgi:hypothetical protein